MDQPQGSKLDPRTVVLVSVAKRQWERTFDAISEPLMIVDEGFVIRRANLALADDLGMAVQRVVGRRCFEARSESRNRFPRAGDSPCDGCPVPAARAGGMPEEAEMRAAEAGRVYRLRAYPLVDDEERMMVCSYRDVTEETLMSRQLANAEKLAAIGRLAGGVAHEINNPLGGILAFTQILMKEALPAEERDDYLREIERSALRCKAIVESLLRFARQTPRTEVRTVALNDCVKTALRTATHKVPLDRVTLETRLAEDLPRVMGEPSQLEQVVLNLLSNAVDSALSTDRGGGRVVIRTSVADGSVRLEVEDNGAGVEEAHLEKLFDPFFTTKEEGKGMGLGLAVTYAIVQEMGGSIAARNLGAGGAIFTVSLPLAR